MSSSTSAPTRNCNSEVLAKLPSQWHPDATVPTLYFFPFSQPSRAVAQLLAEGSVAHKKVIIDILGKQEQKDPLYVQYINPAAQVPVIFKPGEQQWMAESNDIMRYVVSQNSALESWYPFSSASACSVIDARLKFIAEQVRPMATGMLRSVLVHKDKKDVKAKLAALPALIAEIESQFTSDSAYFANGAQPTLADLQLFHEIVATKDIGFFPWQEKTAPKLTRWYKAMKHRKATKETYSMISAKVRVIGTVLAVKKLFGGLTI